MVQAQTVAAKMAQVQMLAACPEGSSKTRGKHMSTFPKKSPRKYFSGGFFSFDFLLLLLLSASR
jgi:hypothetical protein